MEIVSYSEGPKVKSRSVSRAIGPARGEQAQLHSRFAIQRETQRRSRTRMQGRKRRAETQTHSQCIQRVTGYIGKSSNNNHITTVATTDPSEE